MAVLTVLSPELEKVVFLAADQYRRQPGLVWELLRKGTRGRASSDAWYLLAKAGDESWGGGFVEHGSLVDAYRATLRFKQSCLRRALEVDSGHTRSHLFLHYLSDVERRVRPEHWGFFVFHRLGFPYNLAREYISPRFVYRPLPGVVRRLGADWPPNARAVFLKAMDDGGAFWREPFIRSLKSQGLKWRDISDLAEVSRHHASRSRQLASRYQEHLRDLDTLETCPVCQRTFLRLDQSGPIPVRLCEICWSATDTKHHAVIEGSPEYCGSILQGVDLTPADPESLKTDLRRLAVLTQTLPFVGKAMMWEAVEPGNVASVVRLLWHMQPRDVYSCLFGSTFRANVEAGVLQSDAEVRLGFGTRCLAADGHECSSLAERAVDDWLYANGIRHEREPAYPVDPDLNPSGELRADWQVGETYIEYLGVLGKDNYDNRVDRKRKLARRHRLPLVELLPEDLDQLDRRLAPLKGAKSGAE